MAIIKVASLHENSINFNIFEGNMRHFVMDNDNRAKIIHEGTISKTVTIIGVHPFNFQNKGFGTYALTDVDSKDWEYIKERYSYVHYIKNGLIFAGKNEMETLAMARSAQGLQNRALTAQLSSNLNGNIQIA